MNMCNCASLPAISKYRRSAENYLSSLPNIPGAPSRWIEYTSFRYCPECGQKWKLNEDNRSSYGQVAIKIPSDAMWSEFDESGLRKQFIVECHGGFSDEECLIAGCTRKRLLENAYCVECAYSHGARE